MSKRAEEAAWKAYPGKITVINEDGTESIWEDSVLDGERRRLFVKGYEQAEKDLALTWEDVAILITIYEAGIENGDYRRYNDAEWMKEYSQDILRKFNEIRKK